MHSPEVLAFSIKRPWPDIRKRRDTPVNDARGKFHWQMRIFSRNRYISPFIYIGKYELYFPSAIDIWHMEPGGKDALTVCERRWKDEKGKWHYSKAWKWHIWHWKISPVFIYTIRRRLLTRCAECGGPDRKGHRVNVSNGGWYGGPKVPIWCGEVHLFHSECLSKVTKHHHQHDPRGCYNCSGSSSFEFKRQNATQHKLPLIRPGMPAKQRKVLESLHTAVQLRILPYDRAVETYNNKRKAAQWV